MAREEEGAKFVRYFGPLLDALRGLGGSAKPDEAVDRVVEDLRLSDNVLNETLPYITVFAEAQRTCVQQRGC